MIWRQMLDRLIIGGVLVGSAVAYEAPVVLICGLLVGGSVLPLAFKAYRDRRMGAGLPTLADLEAMLDRKLAELEERQSQQFADIEYRNAQLVESVEERIDFTEQLLRSRHDPSGEEVPMGLPIVKPIKVKRLGGL